MRRGPRASSAMQLTPEPFCCSRESSPILLGCKMQLAEFIQKNHEIILKDWEAFARTLRPAADGMSKAELRDHAAEILTAIVRDMESLESTAEKASKSKGHATRGHKAAGQPGALGQLHAVLRIERGFTLTQVVAEYRALRASVFRLWVRMRPD